MCLAFPMKLVEVQGLDGIVLQGGVKLGVRLDLVDRPQVGQYLLIHAGYALQVLDEAAAQETLELMQQAYPYLFDPGPDLGLGSDPDSHGDDQT